MTLAYLGNKQRTSKARPARWAFDILTRAHPTCGDNQSPCCNHKTDRLIVYPDITKGGPQGKKKNPRPRFTPIVVVRFDLGLDVVRSAPVQDGLRTQACLQVGAC